MFGLSSNFVSPQTVFPLSSYLLSHCSALRSSSHRKNSSYQVKNSRNKGPEKRGRNSLDNIHQLLGLPENNLSQIESLFTPEKIRDFALLGSCCAESSKNVQWRKYSHLLTRGGRPSCYESHISFNTFDENKRGMSIQSQVNQSLFRKIFSFEYKLLSPLIISNVGSTRGFRSQRYEERRVIREELLSESEHRSEPKLQALLKDGMSKESQTAIKIAFAEGYVAANKEDPKRNSKKIGSILWKLVTFGCLAWLGFFIYLKLAGENGVGFKVAFQTKNQVEAENINVTFDDVRGNHEAKQELEEVVDFLKNPEKYTALGAELPRGVLLVGPPGTGKTLLARAVAGEADVPFFHASGSEFDELFVGQGSKKIRQLFASALARAPCVVFIDEIDSVGAKRTNSVVHPYANQTINQLLSEMDGFKHHEGIIVLGATNRAEVLDKALTRPGRFDVQVQVSMPDLKGRLDILDYYLGKVTLGEDIDKPVLGRGTTGFTGADLKNIVNQAALRAAADGKQFIAMHHLEEARDKVLMGPERKTRIIDMETNRITAFHESGHTLMAYYTKGCDPVHKVTIIPRGGSLGHTATMPSKEQYQQTKRQLLARMDLLMGGRVAKEITFGKEDITAGASDDLKKATMIATAMVKGFGMSEKVGLRCFDQQSEDGAELGDTAREMIDTEIKKILQESYERSKTVLKEHSTELKALADALLRYETLDREDIIAILDGKEIQKEGL